MHDNIMAVGIKAILSEARNALKIREDDPFYEIQIVDSLVSGEQTIDQVMAKQPACIVVQENLGPDEEFQRDSLVLLRQNITNDDTEKGLRVVYAIFDFVERHITLSGFVSTLQTRQRRCPFYITCGKHLRRIDPLICKETPWESADWHGWGHAAICDYAKAVLITRPPESN